MAESGTTPPRRGAGSGGRGGGGGGSGGGRGGGGDGSSGGGRGGRSGRGGRGGGGRRGRAHGVDAESHLDGGAFQLEAQSWPVLAGGGPAGGVGVSAAWGPRPEFPPPGMHPQMPAFAIPAAGRPMMAMMPYPALYTLPYAAGIGTHEESEMTEMLRTQLEYYFSRENLVRDAYLRGQMDGLGFVDIALILSFHKVKRFDPSMVVQCMLTSPRLEVNPLTARVRSSQHWAEFVPRVQSPEAMT